MKCVITTAAAASPVCTVTVAALQKFFPSPALLAAKGKTIFRRTRMELIVGWIFDRTMKNRADYHRRWQPWG